jgi:hypothetical protein
MNKNFRYKTSKRFIEKFTISVLGILWNFQGERIARQFVFRIFRFIYRDKWRL